MTSIIARRRGVWFAAFALCATSFAWSDAEARAATLTSTPAHASDSADVVGALAKFHGALAAGDSAGALALLSPDALILESGGVQTRADYQAHHLAADIEFARAVPSTRTVTRVTVEGGR